MYNKLIKTIKCFAALMFVTVLVVCANVVTAFAAANIDITGCQFSNWGYRAANGLRSDAWLLSIKVSKIEGICYSETDRAAFVKRVKDNNTFTPLSENPQNIPIHTFIINAPGMNPGYYLYD